MKRTTLVIMAAGLGSRFGEGLKQLASVGPNGEIIMDYSIHDAIEAGFNKVVFIIRKDIEKDFKEVIGNRISEKVETAYAYQEIKDVPAGCHIPQGRKKPWGTGQAVLCCKDIIHEPFLVINADDYYGKEAFVKIHDFLVKDHGTTKSLQFCMAGFILKNTLSDNGSVTRGVCKVNDEMYLTKIVETSNLVKTQSGAGIDEDGKITPVDENSYVSMNMWGFSEEIMEILEQGFKDFLQALSKDDIKQEYLLPTIVDLLISSNKAQVTVLKTNDKWFGVTYKEDQKIVQDAFKALVKAGVYKEKI